MKDYLKISFLLLLGICAGESSSPCKGVPDRVHVKNPTGCERFYYCFDEIAVPGVCPPDYYFNLRTGVCNNKDEVYCENQMCEGVANYTFFENPKSCQAYFVCLNEEALEGYCTDDHQIDVPLQRCNLKDVVKCVDPENKACFGVPDGVIIEDPENCENYISCNDQKGELGKCPAGQLFNKKTGKCDDKNNVECGSAQHDICEDVPNGGQVPDPKECKNYYICLQGKAALHSCPPDYYFDSKNLICSSDKNVCNKNAIEYDICRGKKNGELIAHPDVCKKFYACDYGGRAEELECEKGLLFNKLTSTCDAEENVICNDKQKSFKKLFKI